jgi:hypothetical protein
MKSLFTNAGVSGENCIPRAVAIAHSDTARRLLCQNRLGNELYAHDLPSISAS